MNKDGSGYCPKCDTIYDKPHECIKMSVEELNLYDPIRVIAYCCFCKKEHSGGNSCMGHFP